MARKDRNKRTLTITTSESYSVVDRQAIADITTTVTAILTVAPGGRRPRDETQRDVQRCHRDTLTCRRNIRCLIDAMVSLRLVRIQAHRAETPRVGQNNNSVDNFQFRHFAGVSECLSTEFTHSLPLLLLLLLLIIFIHHNIP